MATEKQLKKARASFDYAANQASKCRHGRYQVSCHSCPDEKTCDIQIRIGKARATIDGAKTSYVVLDTPGKRVEACGKNVMKQVTCMACPNWKTCETVKEHLATRVQIGNDEEQF
jgi:hypothetical protein